MNKMKCKTSKIINAEQYNLILEWIQSNHQNKQIQLFLLFDSKKDGFKSAIFHDICDNKGSTVTFYEYKRGYRFGGFTNRNWDEQRSNIYEEDNHAFIFSLEFLTKFNVTNPRYSIY